MCTVLELYDSLTRLVHSQRETFGENEGNALSKVENKKFQVEEKQFTLMDIEIVGLLSGDNIRINTFCIIIDTLNAELKSRQ